MGSVNRTIEINAPTKICYEMWSDFQNFPNFMQHVRNIMPVASDCWHWEVDGPLGSKVEWNAEVDGAIPNEYISWHSLPESHVDNAGSVQFKSLSNNRTRISIHMQYAAPAGALGEFVSDLFSNPERMIEEDLEHFKQLAEQRELVNVGVTDLNNPMDELPSKDREVQLNRDNDPLGRSGNWYGATIVPGSNFESL